MAKSKNTVKEAEKGLKIDANVKSAILDAQGLDRAVLNFGKGILNVVLDMNTGIYGTVEIEGNVSEWHAEFDE